MTALELALMFENAYAEAHGRHADAQQLKFDPQSIDGALFLDVCDGVVRRLEEHGYARS